MRALHSGSLDVRSGGPALSMSLTMKGLELSGIECVGLTEELSAGSRYFDPSQNIIQTHRGRFGTFAYIDNINECIDKVGGVDICHIHGTWMHHGLAVSKFALSLGIPYIVAPRGMLYPQALSHHRLAKSLMMRLYQGKEFSKASCIQATCIEEMMHYRNLGFKNPVAVLPNPIEISGLIDRSIPHKPIFEIGYLGRIHPRKRIERLIYSFANLGEKTADAQLVIIGGGDKTYMDFLKSEVARLGLTNVTFTGFLSGDEKDRAITGLSLLVVPSDFENFGNIVTEALVRGVPVIASKGTPWSSLEQYECGMWVENDQSSLDSAIVSILDLPKSRLVEMGMNGKRFVRETFAVDVLGRKMKLLYEWLLGEGEKPEFVYD